MTSAFKVLVLVITLISSQVVAKDIGSFTRDMVLGKGFYTFYYDEKNDKIYLDIDKLSKPFLFQSSMPQGLGSNDIGLDRGQLGDTRIVQFERYGNKVLLNQINTYYQAHSENNAEVESVKEAFAKSVLHGFKIVSQDKDSVLIDYTPFLLSDIHGVKRRLDSRKQGKFSIDSSRSAVFVERSKAFPKNTELESIVSFKGSAPGKHLQSVAPDAYNITVHLHHSLIELPDGKYQPRVFHPYSGFWSVEHKDYAVSLDEDMAVKYIPRHRLFKKEPTAAKSEAIEPIIYYLDPGAPEPVRSALLDGAKWWNTAFEKAGYINAFQVKMLPEHADPMDVRYNTIQWVHRATRGWSYGSSVIDPRTGEILKGHVTLGSLRVRQDYLIAQGLTAPFKDGTSDTTAVKEMALARIRQLSAHEVGHTLGIAHNFAASVNNRASVMDYPHPLVKITDGKIDLSNAYDDKIGAWDEYVIQYGYSEFSDTNTEQQELSSLIKTTKQQSYLYMSDPDARPLSGAEPNGHLWDNGENPAVELERMLEVRKLALNNFGLGNLAAGRNVSDLQEILVPIYLFHRFQTTAAAKLIAGVDYSYQVKEDSNVGVTAVSFEQQQAALTAILRTLTPQELAIPEHILAIIPPKSYGSSRYRESAPSKTGLVFDPIELAAASAQHSLNALLNSARLNRIAQQTSYDQINSNTIGNWSLPLYLEEILNSTVKADVNQGIDALLHKRVAALTIESLMSALLSEKTAVEVKAEIFQSLNELNTWLASYSRKNSFNNLLSHHLNWYFEHRKWLPLIKSTPLPPGSPI
jgi:hypothetical protein